MDDQPNLFSLEIFCQLYVGICGVWTSLKTWYWLYIQNLLRIFFFLNFLFVCYCWWGLAGPKSATRACVESMRRAYSRLFWWFFFWDYRWGLAGFKSATRAGVAGSCTCASSCLVETLHHAATRCNTLQHAATHCNTDLAHMRRLVW